jgi:hypothetical protein
MKVLEELVNDCNRAKRPKGSGVEDVASSEADELRD